MFVTTTHKYKLVLERKGKTIMVISTEKNTRAMIADCAMVLLKESTDDFAKGIWEIIGDDVIAFMYSYVVDLEETGDFSLDDVSVALGHALFMHLSCK